jgi:hypothetical protein
MVQQASISYQERGTTTASVVDVFGGSHNEYPFTDQTAYFTEQLCTYFKKPR